jgi:hypothetical protein
MKADRVLLKDLGISLTQDLPKPIVVKKKVLLAKRQNLPEERRKNTFLKFYNTAPFITLMEGDKRIA